VAHAGWRCCCGASCRIYPIVLGFVALGIAAMLFSCEQTNAGKPSQGFARK
jgi:hypothetical protein